MQSLETIKGIGPKTQKVLTRLNIKDIQDLIQYYPFRYDIIEKMKIEDLKDQEKVVLEGNIENIPTLFFINRRLDKMTFRLRAEEQLFSVIIFNRGFLKPKLTVGKKIVVIGKYDKKHQTITAAEIRLESIMETKIEPVYHTIYGITGGQIHTLINSSLELGNYESYIPEYLEEKYHFLNRKESIYHIHNPKDAILLKKAENRIKYEELFLFMLEMNYLKEKKNNRFGIKRTISKERLNSFIKTLPFSLTEDQKKAIEEIYQDLSNEKRMNRLLQGDVGSGKTIIAFLAIYMNYLSGYQSALMAPTEILASQHFLNLKKIMEQEDLRIELLTGKLKVKEKRAIYEKLENGQIDVVIGTHALISEQVLYKNLGLVITDEQHRFGVHQRGNLKNKGLTPDILYMSATPIPRTYALTLYGDMDISSIKTMPNGRIPVKTYLRKTKDMKDILTKMLEQLKKKHQIYVIAPLIEESDKVDLTNVVTLKENMEKAFGKYYKIGVLHGKMDNKEKEEAMDSFKKNETQILISTTVVEVGVDVLNATMIVIFDSYRFGLSTLHQLRGRVGRNALESYCILISDLDKKRLEILERTTDGFEISEEDFLLRGSGDLFGEKQSGDMSFGLANVKKDYPILLKAKEDSLEFLKKHFEKEDYKRIRNIVEMSTSLD